MSVDVRAWAREQVAAYLAEQCGCGSPITHRETAGDALAVLPTLLTDERVKTAVTTALFRDGGVIAWLVGSLEGRQADPNSNIAKVALTAAAETLAGRP